MPVQAIPIVKSQLVSLAPERLSHFVPGLVERQANVGDHVCPYP